MNNKDETHDQHGGQGKRPFVSRYGFIGRFVLTSLLFSMIAWIHSLSEEGASFWFLLGVALLVFPLGLFVIRRPVTREVAEKPPPQESERRSSMMSRRFRIRFSLRTLWIAVTAVCLFFGLWSLTEEFGVDSVAARWKAKIESDGIATHLDYYPMIRPAKAGPGSQWHYAGNASSPFPLVVRVDWSVRYKIFHKADGQLTDDYAAGQVGGSKDFFWFFGFVCRM